MKRIVFISVIMAVSIISFRAFSQVNVEQVKRERFIKRVQEQFSKKRFIEELEKLNERAIMTARRVKSDGMISEDKELIQSYSNAQIALNLIIGKMGKDIKAVDNILDFATFNAKARYSAEMDDAQKKVVDFVDLAEQKMSGGEQASLIGELLSKLLGSIFPVFQKAEEVYLDVAKQVISVRLEKNLLPEWKDIDSF